MHPFDVIIVLGWLALTFVCGIAVSRLSSRSATGFFVADRNLPWWVVGTSMVATTFAADTPLAVSGFVAAGGISANWTWWWMGAAGITSVFLVADLWRRSEVLTDAELTELRYDGKAASALRGLKAVWFGVFMNVLTIAWVMEAMRKILSTIVEIPDGTTTLMGLPPDGAIVLGLFLLTVVYTSASGLLGVVITDLMQFVLAMVGSVVLAVLSWRKVGGLPGMQSAFERHGFDWEATTTMVPAFDGSIDTAKFAVLMGVIWWSAKQVDGGGYLAQRLFAAKDDKHAILAYLWFTVAHMCLRPWPWIIVGLAGMALLGPLDDPELYYPSMMREVLPHGWFGLLFASFLAAFMSTIDTQLNWGASLLVNDLYHRFIRPDADDEHLLRVSRIAVLLLAVIGAFASFYVDSLRGAWTLAFSVTAGLGVVYLARWYWWRANAWSEISAMVVAGLMTAGLHQLAASTDTQWLAFPFNAALITLVGAPIWVGVTLLTAPTKRAHLERFYDKVRPGGAGWAVIAGQRPDFQRHGPDRWTFSGIFGGIALVYGSLLGTGGFLLGRGSTAAIGTFFAINGGFIAYQSISRRMQHN